MVSISRGVAWHSRPRLGLVQPPFCFNRRRESLRRLMDRGPSDGVED